MYDKNFVDKSPNWQFLSAGCFIFCILGAQEEELVAAEKQTAHEFNTFTKPYNLPTN